MQRQPTVMKGPADWVRKVRWRPAGACKSGGVRAIYFNINGQEVVLLVMLYAKSERSNVTSAEIEKVL
jgi:hypothetical protein